MLTTRGLYEAAMNSEFLQLICELCVCACAGVSILVSQKQALERQLVKKQQQWQQQKCKKCESYYSLSLQLSAISMSPFHSQFVNNCACVDSFALCHADTRPAVVASPTAGGRFEEEWQQAGGRGLLVTAGSALELVLAQTAYTPCHTCQVRITSTPTPHLYVALASITTMHPFGWSDRVELGVLTLGSCNVSGVCYTPPPALYWS